MPTKKKPARTAPKKPTALARRLTAPHPRPLKRPVVLEPKHQAPVEQLRTLTDDVSLGDLGLVEVKLTEKEEKVLNEPVRVDEIRVKPTGQAYLSHPSYTRWFNRAFGRTGWSIAPASKPMKDGKSVVQPYILFIHGKPAVYAMGEQEYFEANKEQTYGDALEATVASALRRCAKRLGVGLEMWDKPFLDDWMHEHTVKVWLEGKDKPAWRRRIDPPFWNEVSGGGRQQQTSERREPARPVERQAGSHTNSIEPISEKQLRRLWAIIRKSSRTEEEVRDYLRDQFQIAHTKDIPRRHYETICTAIEHPDALPRGRREPGEEG